MTSEEFFEVFTMKFRVTEFSRGQFSTSYEELPNLPLSSKKKKCVR